MRITNSLKSLKKRGGGKLFTVRRNGKLFLLSRDKSLPKLHARQ